MCRPYNGWSNYQTWRVNLEILDDYFASMDEEEQIDLKREGETEGYTYVGHRLRETVSDFLDMAGGEGLVRDYADAFLDDVNWSEIARTQLADVELPQGEEDEEEG